jgi:ribosomal-protein-alanine N-acetyltransferase
MGGQKIIRTEAITETERLILRKWTLDDVDSLFNLNSDPEVVKYTGNDAFKNKQEVIDLISNYEQYEKYNMGRWVVELKVTNEFLGWCGLKYVDDEVDLGYRLLQQHWGKGYATESSVASLDYGFNRLGLKRIIGRAMKENVNSIHVLKKIGMKYEKNTNTFGHPHEQYFITDKMWKEQKHHNNG